MIGTSDALTRDIFAMDLATVAFWGLNAVWVIIALQGLIVHRSFAAACLFAVLWALTLCIYVAAPLLTTAHLSLAESFILLGFTLTVAQTIFDVIGLFGAALGLGRSRDNG
jgi:hypothetical protein